MASVSDIGTTAIEQGVLAAVRSVLGPAESMIPLHEPELTGNEAAYVKDCIDTGWVSSVGAYVDRIEHDLAAFAGVGHAVATANGTAALHICAILAGVEPGDEVLMPTLTFVATANAVSYAGAVPHFVDSEEATLGVDASAIENHLRGTAEIQGGVCVNRGTGARIRALIVMHAFGHPADLDALAAVCERWNLILIEDAAESLGSSYHGRHTGNVGKVSALSFNGNKVMTTGGGGAILTNDPVLARRAKHLTTTARVPHRWNFVHDEIGYNYRLPNLNAALGCAQIERLPDMLARKRRLAERYDAAFADVPDVRFLVEPAGSRSNYWLNTVVLDAAQADQHDVVLAALNDANYMSRPVWTLMHRLPMYANCPRGDLRTAESLASRVINIPSSPKLAD
ncbi:LegC family aminotransferase [Sphingomonas sp. ac-8]|uniref:LegC family aminotransferase n=1 Tax=Sphingomonas sp. ac-8 TaxID=3242977 RepID=UPI003A813A55